MDETIDNLEREVEAALARLAPQLSVHPPTDALSRAAAAARLELNEQWFGEHETPVPSAETLAHVRSAIRDAIAEPRPSTRWRLWGPLSAAAMIGICFGVSYFIPSTKQSSQIEVALVRFVEAGSDIYAEEPLTASIGDDLRTVEDSIAHWRPDHDRIEDGLENIGDELDNLFDETDTSMLTS